eukprot:GILK01000606.1.p1 GENE.GILK01000606.1~~GILK01000606.1.p1  ORF type:complete len:679 (+),score=147.19 GILK01000606.1:205-2037(+)
MADAAAVQSALGVTDGASVTPYDLANDKGNTVKFVMDKDAANASSLSFLPESANKSNISKDEFMAFLTSINHEPTLVDFSDVGEAGAAPAAASEKPAHKKPAPKPKEQNASERKEDVNLLGVSARKETEFADWYTQVITRSEMIEYYDISGCYILRPWSYTIWEKIQGFFDAEIKKLGVENAYFPLFVSQHRLETEKDHVEGFAPEVAWVTKSGQSDLAEPIAIRPTSETIMYPAYANWIRSHRDLPLKLNQWSNVVRWEFKHPTPFIRTREFLWQEGHTVFATKAEADVEVRQILALYRRVYEDLLAVPVIEGVKSEKEKFAGGLYTTTVEAFVPATGRGIQGATSHCLGQNFAKMFHIEFEDDKGEKQLAWQNSWGLTTRTIGVMVMVHGDDKGLVLPPRVAPIQLVLVPIPFKDESPADLIAKGDEICNQLKAAGIRVKLDDRLNYTPGWKYNHWEMKGVPLRAELGPKDIKNRSVRLVRRDNGQKVDVAWDQLTETVLSLCQTIQSDMLERARTVRNGCNAEVDNWNDFMPALNQKKTVLTPWCERTDCEEDVKNKSAAYVDESITLSGSAKTLCLPFERAAPAENSCCFNCGQKATKFALWGRSY